MGFEGFHDFVKICEVLSALPERADEQRHSFEKSISGGGTSLIDPRS
jgi:hypothetical protein